MRRSEVELQVQPKRTNAEKTKGQGINRRSLHMSLHGELLGKQMQSSLVLQSGQSNTVAWLGLLGA